MSIITTHLPVCTTSLSALAIYRDTMRRRRRCEPCWNAESRSSVLITMTHMNPWSSWADIIRSCNNSRTSFDFEALYEHLDNAPPDLLKPFKTRDWSWWITQVRQQRIGSGGFGDVYKGNWVVAITAHSPAPPDMVIKVIRPFLAGGETRKC